MEKFPHGVNWVHAISWILEKFGSHSYCTDYEKSHVVSKAFKNARVVQCLSPARSRSPSRLQQNQFGFRVPSLPLPGSPFPHHRGQWWNQTSSLIFPAFPLPRHKNICPHMISMCVSDCLDAFRKWNLYSQVMWNEIVFRHYCSSPPFLLAHYEYT